MIPPRIRPTSASDNCRKTGSACHRFLLAKLLRSGTRLCGLAAFYEPSVRTTFRNEIAVAAVDRTGGVAAGRSPCKPGRKAERGPGVRTRGLFQMRGTSVRRKGGSRARILLQRELASPT